MSSESLSPTTPIYQLKISLLGISPMIWRRLLVPGSTRIAELHHIIQIAMGWSDYHLHRFRIYAKEYGISYIGGISFSDNPHEVRLADFGFQAGDRFEYEYDFGDSWLHELRVEKIISPEPKKTYPLCLDGKRACPPEDCGGAWQYLAILHVLKKPFHPDREELLSELGKSFNPEAFNRQAVNGQLRSEFHDN